jgi:hypothetical protein
MCAAGLTTLVLTEKAGELGTPAFLPSWQKPPWIVQGTNTADFGNGKLNRNMSAKEDQNTRRTNNPKGGSVTSPPKALPLLPDPEICRTHYTGVAFMAQCLVDTPQRCGFAQQYGGAFYCHHSDRLKFDKAFQGNSK